jgi:prolyl 4-hydroxylase
MGYHYDSDEDSNGDKEEPIEETSQRKRKRRSRTVIDNSHRTSTFHSFRKLQDSRISALERRIAALLGCWVHQIEPLQLVRYMPGQFFGLHHDMGDLLEDDGDDIVTLPRKNIVVKRRLVTIFCYLNTLQEDQGGATYFPKCGHLRVIPKRGRAVLWSNVTAEGQPDARTIHAGEPVVVINTNTGATASDDNKVTAGNDKNTEKAKKCEPTVVKYGLNIWICEE